MIFQCSSRLDTEKLNERTGFSDWFFAYGLQNQMYIPGRIGQFPCCFSPLRLKCVVVFLMCVCVLNTGLFWLLLKLFDSCLQKVNRKKKREMWPTFPSSPPHRKDRFELGNITSFQQNLGVIFDSHEKCESL